MSMTPKHEGTKRGDLVFARSETSSIEHMDPQAAEAILRNCSHTILLGPTRSGMSHSGMYCELRDDDDLPGAIASPASSPWFIPILTLILLLGMMGSALLWRMFQADAEATRSWMSYRDEHCARAAAPGVDRVPSREHWQCGRERYSAPIAGTPVEFRIREARNLFELPPAG